LLGSTSYLYYEVFSKAGELTRHILSEFDTFTKGTNEVFNLLWHKIIIKK